MTNERYLVLSALGSDRPGLVADVTDYIAVRGGNIEDSRMAILGSEFGMMLLISGTDAQIDAIVRDKEELHARAELHILTKPTTSPEEHRRAAVIPCLITADALDHEGIVRAVAKALHASGINIVSLETSSYHAPVTGSPLFRLEARVDVPRGVTMASLRSVMDRVAYAENIDVEVRALVGARGLA